MGGFVVSGTCDCLRGWCFGRALSRAAGWARAWISGIAERRIRRLNGLESEGPPVNFRPRNACGPNLAPWSHASMALAAPVSPVKGGVRSCSATVSGLALQRPLRLEAASGLASVQDLTRVHCCTARPDTVALQDLTPERALSGTPAAQRRTTTTAGYARQRFNLRTVAPRAQPHPSPRAQSRERSWRRRWTTARSGLHSPAADYKPRAGRSRPARANTPCERSRR